MKENQKKEHITPIKEWDKNRRSKFNLQDINIEPVDEVEEEISKECDVCNKVYVVDKNSELIINKSFLCATCCYILGKILRHSGDNCE